MRVLFVEDSRAMIVDLVDAIQRDEPAWELDFAYDIPSAWGQLCSHEYDALIVDVMLPAWPHVPARSEGIYLVKWLRSPDGKHGVAQPPRGTVRPANTKAKVVFLTSRTANGVKMELDELEGLLVIGRLEMDEMEVFKELKEIPKQPAGQ
jgi:CheY-like chemotaxis protein